MARLMEFEGEILHAYQDSKGYWTIGVGHLIDKRLGGGIPRNISRLLLELDIERATAEARHNFQWFDDLDTVRQDFIVMMIYNIGVPRLKGFVRMLKAIERKDWDAAGAELMDSDWSDDVGQIRSESMRDAIQLGIWV